MNLNFDFRDDNPYTYFERYHSHSRRYITINVAIFETYVCALLKSLFYNNFVLMFKRIKPEGKLFYLQFSDSDFDGFVFDWASFIVYCQEKDLNSLIQHQAFLRRVIHVYIAKYHCKAEIAEMLARDIRIFKEENEIRGLAAAYRMWSNDLIQFIDNDRLKKKVTKTAAECLHLICGEDRCWNKLKHQIRLNIENRP